MTEKPQILYIEHIDFKPGSGKPKIAGRGITVALLSTFLNDPEWPPERICQGYNLTLAQLYAAWSYYYDHQEEIDQAIKEGDELARKIARPTNSLPGYAEFMEKYSNSSS